MAKNNQGESSQRGNNGGAADETRIRARPDPLLVVCRCFRFITSLAAILCIAVNVLSTVRSFKDGSDIFDGTFRCHAVAIAIFVVVAETEWKFILDFWKILEYWAGRGMLQIFVAAMTRAYPNYSDERKEIVLLQNIAGYVLIACGVLYVISRCRQEKEVSREQAVKDLQELERRREELEALLIVDP